MFIAALFKIATKYIHKCPSIDEEASKSPISNCKKKERKKGREEGKKEGRKF
jgi:hypothetical protein